MQHIATELPQKTNWFVPWLNKSRVKKQPLFSTAKRNNKHMQCRIETPQSQNPGIALSLDRDTPFPSFLSPHSSKKLLAAFHDAAAVSQITAKENDRKREEYMAAMKATRMRFAVSRKQKRGQQNSNATGHNDDLQDMKDFQQQLGKLIKEVKFPLIKQQQNEGKKICNF